MSNEDSNNSQQNRSVLYVNEVLESTDDNEEPYQISPSEEDRYYNLVTAGIKDSLSESGLWGLDWDYEEPNQEDLELDQPDGEYGRLISSDDYCCGYCISAYFLDACAGDGTLIQYYEAVSQGELMDITGLTELNCTCSNSDDDWIPDPMEVDSETSEEFPPASLG